MPFLLNPVELDSLHDDEDDMDGERLSDNMEDWRPYQVDPGHFYLIALTLCGYPIVSYRDLQIR